MKLTGVALGVIALVGAGSVAGAWYTGGQVEQTLRQQLSEASQMLKEQQREDFELELSLDSISRGVFATDARYRLRITDPESGNAQDLLFVDHVEHGPFPPSRLKSGQLAPVMATSQFSLENTPLVAGWFKAAGERTPLHGNMLVHYDQSFSGQMVMEPARWSEPAQGSLIESSGMQLGFESTAEARQVRLTGQMERLVFERLETGRGTRLHLNALSLDSDLSLSPNELYVGSNLLRIGSMELTIPGQPGVELQQLEFSGSSSEEDNQLSGRSQQQIGSIRIKGQEFGALQAAFSLERFDATELRELNQVLSTYADQMSADGRADEAVQQQVLAGVGQILEGQPYLSLDELTLKTASGEARLSLAVDLARPQGWNLQNPPELLRQLVRRMQLRVAVDQGLIRDVVMFRGQLDPRVDREALSQEAEMTARMAGNMAVGMQLATLEGERISSRLDYEGDMIDFNGQRMPAERFVRMLQGMRGQGAGMQ